MTERREECCDMEDGNGGGAVWVSKNSNYDQFVPLSFGLKLFDFFLM